MRFNPIKTLAVVAVPGVLLVAGCGGRVSAFSGAASDEKPLIQAAASRIDTAATTQFRATLPDGEPARAGSVEWSVSGGDPTAGPGTISASGLYTPPSYLTEDAVKVSVSAALAGQPSAADTAELTVTPGFLQPLTPENLSLGANASVLISGSMTEVGGNESIHFSLASDPAGTPSDAGSLSATRCVRGSVSSSNPAYTVCSVTYTAPAAVAANAAVYIVGTVAGERSGSPARSWTRVLLNSAGIVSNPAAHQAHLAAPVELGSSSGNNSDYDASQGQLSDCCGGTIGALLQDTAGTQYVLSNNHVLARSDQSIVGETIIQPGLIDNGCTPYGFGPGTTPVATLSNYLTLALPTTNVDAAVARVTPGAVDPKGSILELGTKLPDGTLSAAPPGVSSTQGKGETASLGMMVAKSGRTTGLTCAAVAAVNVDVLVDYFTDCAETSHAFTKTFTNQIAIEGTNFSDAGDSGALVVDAANAEPVGLFFAGGTDAHGVEHAIANPVGDVLTALNGQAPAALGPAAYSFVGGADHPVSCLNYDSKPQEDTSSVASLPQSERERAETAMPTAQVLLNPAAGIVRVAAAVSKDHPGEAAIKFTLEPWVSTATAATIPAAIGGVPTMIGPEAAVGTQPRAASLAQAVAAKQKVAASLFRSNAAIFGVGVGQSLDDPAEAAVVLYVDRKQAEGKIPESVDGVRVRVVLMDRLHVTRSHGTGGTVRSGGSCLALPEARTEGNAPELGRDRLIPGLATN